VRLVTDTREQAPLVFPKVVGVEYVTEKVPTGDYSAWHDDTPDESVVERKSVADCFTSFTSNYEAERRKIKLARELNLRYVLAIEATATQILQGYQFWTKDGLRDHRKSGMAMLKQLMTIQRKYQVTVWFCAGRDDMAMRILEYFLAWERVK